jgi:hypothetical protein
MTTFSVQDYSNTAIQIGAGFKENQSIEFFEYKSMKSIGKMRHNDGNWYVIINFFSNDVLNPLRINLSLVDNQATWTNDIEGADTAVSDIQVWMSTPPVNATIVSPLGTLSVNESVSVALASDQFNQKVTPYIISASGTNGVIGLPCWSISFASNGTAAALVSFDGGSSYVSLPVGTTINMTAGIFNWFYDSNTFNYDTTTNAGASLIITYNA